MDELAIISLLAFGFALGLKHAVEADHIAAISTIVTEKQNIRRASLVGGLWGIGHAIALFAAAAAYKMFSFEINERVSQYLELCVALMLILLGLNAFIKLFRDGQMHWHAHRHGQRVHLHPHIHNSSTAHLKGEPIGHNHHQLKFGLSPLVIGMIHGLAGSGIIMLLMFSMIDSDAISLFFILVFGIGSIGGMILMSILMSLPLRLMALRFSRADTIIRSSAAFFSLGIGTFMLLEIAAS